LVGDGVGPVVGPRGLQRGAVRGEEVERVEIERVLDRSVDLGGDLVADAGRPRGLADQEVEVVVAPDRFDDV
jgi:hypothetical protein